MPRPGEPAPSPGRSPVAVPGRPAGGGLPARAATMLAERDSIAVPFLSTEITSPAGLKIFNLVWTGLTVLWFMQIFPKHMAATNADRYLKVTRAALFPIVEFVRVIGVSWPAEKFAMFVQNRLGWHPEPTLE